MSAQDWKNGLWLPEKLIGKKPKFPPVFDVPHDTKHPTTIKETSPDRGVRGPIWYSPELPRTK